MSNIIKLPDGNAISPAVIKSVVYYRGKGVMCRDAQTRYVCYIKTSTDEQGELARDLLIKIVNDGARASQPDWSFLIETNN